MRKATFYAVTHGLQPRPNALAARRLRRAACLFMGWVTGLEPATFGATVRRSNQLSYTHHEWLGTPGGIRTPDLEIRSLPLYPAELRALISVAGRASARQHTMGGGFTCQEPGEEPARIATQLSDRQRSHRGITPFSEVARQWHVRGPDASATSRQRNAPLEEMVRVHRCTELR